MTCTAYGSTCWRHGAVEHLVKMPRAIQRRIPVHPLQLFFVCLLRVTVAASAWRTASASSCALASSIAIAAALRWRWRSSARCEGGPYASQALLTAVWTAASNSANTNLQTAQAGWEQERAEAEACRQQLASAFDSQSEELATAQRNADAMEQKFAVQANELQAAATNLEKLRHEAAEAEGWAATAEARAKEIGQRADDLKTDLARAHTSADQERLDSKHRLEAADSTIASLRDELRQRLAQENDVREELARLRGQVDAMAEERQALLATLKPNAKVSTPTRRPAATKTKAPNGA